MSLDDNSATEVLPGSNPEPDETQAPTTALGHEAVPLRDPADGELMRERERRVRVVVRRRRPGHFALARGRTALELLAVGLVGLVVIVAAVISLGGSTPYPSRPANASMTNPPASVDDPSSAKPVTAGGVAQARRRAALSARDKAARRRARQRREHPASGARKVQNKRPRERSGAKSASESRTESAASPSSKEAVAPPAPAPEASELSVAEAPPPSPSGESAAPTAAEPTSQPSGGASAPASSGEATQPSSLEQGESQAESEFGFEK